MARLLNRQSASSHAHLALRISAGGLGSERAYLELEARFGWLRRRVAHRALTQTAAEAIVCEALADTILGPPHVEAAWTNALFAGHMRRRANKIANLAVAQREGLPLDFVAMRSFLRRVIDRLEGLLGCPPSVTAVLADPAVIARRKPVPPSYVEWLLDERGGRFVRLDTSERTLDDLLGAMDESLCIEQPYPDHALALASRYDHIRLFVELVLREEGYTFEEIAQLVRRPEPPALHDTRTGEALSWHAVAAEWPGIPSDWEKVRALYRKPDGTYVDVPAIRKAHRTGLGSLGRSEPDAAFLHPHDPTCRLHLPQELQFIR